jgi:hypothetical protein
LTGVYPATIAPLPNPQSFGEIQTNPILSLHLQPALLAGFAMVARTGPEMLQVQGLMMGDTGAVLPTQSSI